MFKKVVFIYLISILSFIFGAIVSYVDNGPLLSVKSVFDDVYLFVKGHPEEKTSLFNKLSSQFLGNKRIDINNDVITSTLNYSSDKSYRASWNIPNSNIELALLGRIPSGTAIAMVVNSSKEGSFLILINDSYELIFINVPNIIDFHLDARGFLALSEYNFSSYSLCGELLWSVPGAFHHYFTPNDDKIAVLGTPMNKTLLNKVKALDKRRVYTDANYNITIINRLDGSLVKTFDFHDIAKANISKFDPLVIEKTASYRTEIDNDLFVNVKDVWHPNDLNFFPNDFSSVLFDSNDLLVSAKGYNLLFVVDSDDLNIKWFDQGHLQGQHDPDWLTGDSFTVFNNRSENNISSPFSSIEKFNFSTSSWETLIDGSLYDAVSRHSGGHSNFDKFYLLSMTLQGRNLIVDATSKEKVGEIKLFENSSPYNTQESYLLDVSIFDSISRCNSWSGVNSMSH